LKGRPKNGFFVTGTDTEVGKTVVSALLMILLRQKTAVGYWKPVQTGIEQDNDTFEVKRLSRASDQEIIDDGVRLQKPLSPHLSAQLAGTRISVEQILTSKAEYADDRTWIVEGAGGILVPLNEAELVVDLIQKLALPAIVVSRSGLGTINHTLLTLEALRRREIEVAGVVMNGVSNVENRQAIEKYGNTTVLMEVPKVSSVSDPEMFALSEKVEFDYERLGRWI